MNDKPISSALQWYRDHGPSPWATAAGLGGMAALGGLALWKPAVETARSLGRPLAAKFGGEEGRAAWDEKMDRWKNSGKVKAVVLGTLGLAGTAGALGLFVRPENRNFGLLNWNDHRLRLIKESSFRRQLEKVAAWDVTGGSPYIGSIDYGKPVSLNAAASLFQDDPHLAGNDYVRNLGTSIVSNAGIQNRTSRPTLGNILDSAVDKLNTKLSFGGVAQAGVRSMVANTTARLFTGALGSMFDISPRARQNLVDAGTWAGAVTSILN